MSWEEIVGAANVRPGTPGDAVDGIVPGHVVRPPTREALRAVVASAGQTNRSLVATGGRAHLDVGGVPRACDVLLDTGALDRVIDHQTADMTVTVEAGCPLPVLAETLAAAGQWLPLDPPHAKTTTVGGLIAANLSGPLRTSQGTVRDLLLGLRVVGADGTVVSAGGKVVKNVAGYDLPKLHVGALGTLGVIVEATFKVRPRPDGERGGVIVTASHVEAATLALEFRAVMDPFWLEAGDLPGDRIGVAVGIAGTTEELRGAVATVEAVLERSARSVEWRDDARALRQALADLPHAPASGVLRASVLPSDVPWCMQRIAAYAGPVLRLAHVGSGVVRVRIDAAPAVGRVVRALRPEIEARHGHLVVERATPDAKRGLDVWGNPGDGLSLMRRVKAAFDPRGVFAPGRQVGDI